MRCGPPAAPLSVVVVGDTYWPLDEIADFVGADVAASYLPASRAGGVASMSGRPWRAGGGGSTLAGYLAAT